MNEVGNLLGSKMLIEDWMQNARLKLEDAMCEFHKGEVAGKPLKYMEYV